jgi:hypothetical protein
MKFAKAAALLMSLSIVGMSLCACAGEPEPVSSDINIISTQAQNTGSATETSAAPYVFDYNNFIIGTPIDRSKLPENYDEVMQASCAGVGLATVFSTNSFEVELRLDSEIIAQVRLKDDTVSTPEGIKISDTLDDVKSVYGDEPFLETSGAIEYAIDNYRVHFEFDNTGKITYIFYLDPEFI